MQVKEKLLHKRVLVRCDRSGVHYGILSDCSDNLVTLELNEARRIWYWEGAFTLSQVANKGISSNSKLSEKVKTIYLTDVIEIIPLEDKAYECLEGICDYVQQ